MSYIAEPKTIPENRQEWFSMLVAYMKMKTWATWLSYYPSTCYENFDLIWPMLFDQMLAQATEHSLEKLKSQRLGSLN